MTWICRSEATRQLITGWFSYFASHGVRMVRLDAVGYVTKKAGTSCFMVEPETDAIDWLISAASRAGLEVLPEIHDVYATHETLAARGYWTYDFVLPGLTLLAFESGDATGLAHHLARSPERQVTTLDCHDGIPVNPDLVGVLEPAEMRRLAEIVLARGGNINRMLSDSQGNGVDVHQLNCTYYSALGEDDDRYLAARAIQLFAPGIPQVYYVGLLAGRNDVGAVERTGEGRAINRHDYTRTEIGQALERSVVRRTLELLRLRRTHAAFSGRLTIEAPLPNALRLAWSAGAASCVLDVDVISSKFQVTIDGQVDQTGGVMRAG